MPLVYVINKGPHDYSAAERFGELIYCTDGNLDKWDIAQHYRILDDILVDSAPDDYLLLTSLASLCSIACAIFALKHSCLNLLIFTREGYVGKSLFFDN